MAAPWLLLAACLINALSLAHGYQYIGCFADSGNRDLPVQAGTDHMSAVKCNQRCAGRGFAYFGLQFATECWCGNGFAKHGARPQRECNRRCTGNRHEFCGAGWRNSIYATGLSPLHVPAVSHPWNPNVRDQLAARIKSQYVTFPNGVLCDGCLIVAWSRREVDVKSKVFPVSQLNSVLASYPAKVRDKVMVLQFGANAKTTFEDFHVQVSGGNGRRKSYIGMARRANGNVELGMVAVDLVGHLVQKYNVYHRRVCRKILWVFRKCNTHTTTERRGYHASEINLIDRALQSETFRLFGEVLAQVNV